MFCLKLFHMQNLLRTCFSKERMEQLLNWSFTLNSFSYLKQRNQTSVKNSENPATFITNFKKEFKNTFEFFEILKNASDRSEYKVEEFLKICSEEIKKKPVKTRPAAKKTLPKSKKG